MVSGLRLFPILNVLFQLFFCFESPGVEARHHYVIGIPPPIGASDRADLESISRYLFGGINVRAFAHIQERSVSVKAEAFKIVFFKQLLSIFALVGLLHFLDTL